jgi:hypothetical protein
MRADDGHDRLARPRHASSRIHGMADIHATWFMRPVHEGESVRLEPMSAARLAGLTGAGQGPGLWAGLRARLERHGPRD